MKKVGGKDLCAPCYQMNGGYLCNSTDECGAAQYCSSTNFSLKLTPTDPGTTMAGYCFECDDAGTFSDPCCSTNPQTFAHNIAVGGGMPANCVEPCRETASLCEAPPAAGPNMTNGTWWPTWHSPPTKAPEKSTATPTNMSIGTMSPTKVNGTFSPIKLPDPNMTMAPSKSPAKDTQTPTAGPTTVASALASQRDAFCKDYYKKCVVTGKGADFDPTPHVPNQESITICTHKVALASMDPGRWRSNATSLNTLACREYHLSLATDWENCPNPNSTGPPWGNIPVGCPWTAYHCRHAGPDGGDACTDPPTSLIPPTKAPAKPTNNPSKAPTKVGDTHSPTKAPVTESPAQTSRPTFWAGPVPTPSPPVKDDDGMSSSGVAAIVIVCLLFAIALGGFLFIKKPWESKRKSIDHMALADAQQYSSAE